ncbi:MAG: hypothetical protein ABEI54_03125, partial [Candidatus Bipolaricaulia bacterium]
MALQTDNFPPVGRPEQSFNNSLRAIFQRLYPHSIPLGQGGMRLYLQSGTPSAGLTPVLTDGYAMRGDWLVGPLGDVAITDAPSNSTKGMYYGLKGEIVYADQAQERTDIFIGQLTTDADGIIHTAQQLVYAPDRFAVWGR